MMRWKLQSNVTDVLGLGPRTAGLLATVGIHTVEELLAANAQHAAARLRHASLSAATITAWQHETQLILESPELPTDAARMLAAGGIGSLARIKHSTPTELLAIFETAQQANRFGWLAGTTLPSITALSRWIHLANQQEKNRAA